MSLFHQASVVAILAFGLAGGAAGTEPAPDFRSDYLAVGFGRSAPSFTFFSVDSLGQGKVGGNVVLKTKLPTGSLALQTKDRSDFGYVPHPGSRTVEHIWDIALAEKSLTLRSHYIEGQAARPFTLVIDQKKDHATLLGMIAQSDRRVALPCVLHLPDMGTFRIHCDVPGCKLDYDARRMQPGGDFVRVEFPAATREHPSVAYTLNVVTIYPAIAGLKHDARFDGFRRNFLNIFQLNPRLHSLANNSSSDVCGLCFYEYSEVALRAPPLAEGLTCLDLLRLSLDRVLDGGLTYGQAGYKATAEYPEAAPWGPPHDSLDTAPSLLIAACNYVRGANDWEWAGQRYDKLAAWGRAMLAKDRDGNGLIEYEYSGNAGSWSGRGDMRPANWWDTIGFGHEDAYSNALAYRACQIMAEVAGKLGREPDRAYFAAKAAKLRAAYYRTFFNPRTGILAGWKSADGKLHDYWFLGVNSMAISLGLVDGREANAIMDRLLKKMQEVGYNDFGLGLPGNLIPVRREDYTERNRRFGGGTRADGSDGFQIYENGGATACHAYWTVKALYKLGRKDEARRILFPMLKSFAEGSFQGVCAGGNSKDWKDWRGGCWGYEGFLCDGYLALLAVFDEMGK